MKPNYLSIENINQLIEAAIAEDVGDGDHSSLASIPAGTVAKAQLIIKDEGIIAGVELAQYILQKIDTSLQVEVFVKDGDVVHYGDIGLKIYGSAHAILKAERLLLNCMQRMSGIATFTRKIVDLISHTKAKLLDTRKTTPNFRIMEKWAVAIGGGINHRMGLYDKIMLKDNHIDFAGGIQAALNATHQYLAKLGKQLSIEVETRNLKEVAEVLEIGGVDVIMLDNMTLEEMKQALKLIQGRYKTEASGGITLETIKDIAECGVDYISMGALTHSFKSMDISLKAVAI